MNRINFNGKNGGIFHHLTPYSKKSSIVKKETFIHTNGYGVEVIQNEVQQQVVKNIRQQFHTRYDEDWPGRTIKNICYESDIKILEEKIDLKKEKISVINNPTEYGHKNGFRKFHTHQIFKTDNGELSVSDSVGGCGMQQFYGWTTIKNTKIAYDLIDYYIKNRHSGVGIILCQLGQTYFRGPFETALIKHGFKILSEYKNFMHGSDGRYTQKIYGLELTLESRKPDERNN